LNKFYDLNKNIKGSFNLRLDHPIMIE